ncbi:MAG: chromosome segregation protein SMC [Candidatus Thermoplasmatota archaeon]|nr:chromosome segregation protein SMC [Candidatus Thermoplasmatota archaeon]
MYLKEIELENFKSFARKTRIPLLHGYTSVTGPNGAGKSNVTDAILFVLGPKSSRVIRAGKLTDLIFNGGKDKKPATECKVSLIFSNEDRLIPIDSNIVKLTRVVRVSESADGYYSYFYVNDRKSSLGEFDSLLANARISADGYNFVQQGDITRIVEMSNLERRRILDDIAGITKFDQDIQNADKERGVAEENVARLSIILDEIRKQMKQLEKDREGALKYKDIHERLAFAKAALATKHRDSVDREIASLHEQVDKNTAEKAKAEEKKGELHDEHRQIADDLTAIENEIVERGGEEAKQIKERIDSLRIELARAKDAQDNTAEMTESLEEVKVAQTEDIKAVRKDLTALEEKLAPLEEDHKLKSGTLESNRNELTSHKDMVSKTDSELSNIQKETVELAVKVTSMDEKHHALKLELDRLTERESRLKLDIANIEETKKTYEFELKDSEWSLKELKDETFNSGKGIKKQQEEYYALRNKEKKLSQQYQDLDNAIKSLTREYNQIKAEAEAKDLIKKGYNSATSALMECRDRGSIKGIHGTVAELADVSEDYETALNVAAGHRMQSIVVDNDEVASQCISHLKKDKLGRATFLPLNKMLDGRPRGKAVMAANSSLGFAIDLVKFDEKYRTAFWFVFGDTVVVKTLGDARKLMGGVRLVTLEGELAEASGAMVGGTLDRNLLKFGAASESKLEKKSTELRAAIDSQENIQGELAELKTRLSELEGQIRDSNTKDSGESIRISTLQAKKKEFDQKLASIANELEVKGRELTECLGLIEKVNVDIDRFAQETQKIKMKKEAMDKKLMDATPHELSQKLKKLESEIFELSSEVSALSSEIQTIRKQIELVTGRKNELTAGLDTTNQKIEELKAKHQESQEKQVQVDTELKALQNMERSMGDKLNSLRTKRDSLYKKKTDTESSIEKQLMKAQTCGDIVLSLQTKIADMDKRLLDAQTDLAQYESIVLPQDLPTTEDLKATVIESERTINTLGNVNLKAIDEFDEKRLRHEELKEEVSQLNKQNSNLMKLVAELNDKKKVGFLKIFGGINENFKKTFAELSAGGDAELLLENEEDPLSGGLIIKARPKDKKVVRMHALSGGEKSLTALSFIFAIQAHEPSPFYLLDEVDMFLDGINAENVAKAVKRSSKNAQFIQISLRKVTLKESDHIIGVTMQRDGMSEVVFKPNIGDMADNPAEPADQPPLQEEAA